MREILKNYYGFKFQHMSSSLSVSYSSIIRVIVVLISLVFLYLIRDIILILFLSFIIAAALDPWVNWFERRRLPRAVGVFAAYAVFFTILSVIGVLLAPAVAHQFKELSASLPGYYERFLKEIDAVSLSTPEAGQEITGLAKTLGSFAGNIIPALRSAIGGGFTIFLLLVLTFYLAIEDRSLKRLLRSILPDQYQPYLTRMINRIDEKIGLWFRGQLLLSFIIFILTAIGLFIVHQITGEVPFWLLLALIAGVLEVIPFLGPGIAGIIAVLLVLPNSFPVAVIVAVLSFVIQQIENNLLVPNIMQKSVGLNPIIVILVIVIGTRLAGVLGALIAIPLTASLMVVLKDIRSQNPLPSSASAPPAEPL